MSNTSFRIYTPFTYLADVIRNEESGGIGAQGPAGSHGSNGFQGPNGLQGPEGSGSGFDINVNPVRYGYESGAINQSLDSVAIGISAGRDSQQPRSVAIGSRAGQVNQGENAIAIGADAGLENQSANSIVLNASNQPMNPTRAGFYVQPVAEPPSTNDQSSKFLLGWVPDENEIRGTFVQEKNLSDTLLGLLNLPPRGDTGALNTPGIIDYKVAGMFYESPFQQWNVVYVPSGSPGTNGFLRFTENNIASQMTLDSFMEVGIGLTDVGDRWEEVSSEQLWKGVSMSISGQYQTAILSSTSDVYVSNDFGRTWTISSLPNSDNWVDVKLSTSGQYQVILSSTTIYQSEDFGQSWTVRFSVGGEEFTSVQSVADGSRWYATSTNPGRLYFSSDYGRIWVFRFFFDFTVTPAEIYVLTGYMTSFAIASGGYVSYLTTNQPLAGSTGSLQVPGIYRSFNEFTDDPKALVVPQRPWKRVVCSGSGKTVVAIADGFDDVYCSNDYGSTWTIHIIPNVQDIAISFTGQYILLVQNVGSAHISSTFGGNFNVLAGVANEPWQGAAMSGTGQLMAIVGSNTFVNRAENCVCASFGERGLQGFVGFQGFQGSTGSGERGFQGFEGSQGYDGFQGFQGSTGSGERGFQGLQGLRGFDGYRGYQGFTGVGEQGYQGLQGFTGTEGYQGYQGPFGGGLVYQGLYSTIGPTGSYPDYFSINLPEGAPQQITVFADNVSDTTTSPIALNCRLNDDETVGLTNTAHILQAWTITRLGLGNRWTITTGQGSISTYVRGTLSSALTTLQFSATDNFTADIYIYYQ